MKRSFYLIAFLIALFALIGTPLKYDLNFDASALQEFQIKPSVAQAALTYTPGTETEVTKVLANEGGRGDWIRSLYKTILAIYNVVLIVFLLFLAFANILHINIETYAIKKMLPTIIIATVAANLALPAFTIASKIVDSLHQISLLKPSTFDPNYLFRGMTINSRELGLSTPLGFFSTGITIFFIGAIFASGIGPLACCFGALIWLGGIIILILLHLILDFRPYIIYLAAALSPAAIACSILPQTQTFFKKWLTIAVVWMIMPLVVYGLINLGYKIPISTSSGAGGWWIGRFIGLLLPALLRMGLLFVAFRFPFSIEKDVSGAIAFLGQKTGAGLMRAPAAAGSLKKIPTIRKWASQPAGTGRRKIADFVGGFSDLVANPTKKMAFWASQAKDIDPATGKRTVETDRSRRLGWLSNVLSYVPSPTFFTYLPEILDHRKKQRESDYHDAAWEDSNYGWGVIDDRTKARVLTESNSKKGDDLTYEELRADLQREYQMPQFTKAFARSIDDLPTEPLALCLRAAIEEAAARANAEANSRALPNEEDRAVGKAKADADLAGVNLMEKGEVLDAMKKAGVDPKDKNVSENPLMQMMAQRYAAYLAAQSSMTRRGLHFGAMNFGDMGPDDAYKFLRWIQLLTQKSSRRFDALTLERILDRSFEDVRELRGQSRGSAGGAGGEGDEEPPPEGGGGGGGGGDGLDDEFLGPESDVGSILGRSGPGGKVEVTNLDEIGPAVAAAVKDGLVVESPATSAVASERMLNQIGEQLRSNGISGQQVQKMIEATRNGNDDLLKGMLSGLPDRIARPSRSIFSKALGADRLATEGALENQSAQSIANFVDRIAPRLSQVNQAGGPSTVGRAAEIIVKNEQNVQINANAGKPVLPTMPQGQLNGPQTVIGRIMGIPAGQVNANMATGAVQALELLSARSKKAA